MPTRGLGDGDEVVRQGLISTSLCNLLLEVWAEEVNWPGIEKGTHKPTNPLASAISLAEDQDCES